MRPALVFVMFVASCARDAVVPVPASSGDLIVVAIGDERGHIAHVEHWKTNGSQSSLRIGDDQAAYWWRIPAVVGPSDAIGARLASDPGLPGSCERCLVPSLGPPFIATPGSSCPAPAWAGAGVGPDGAPVSAQALERAASEVRIVVFGECPCPAREDPRRLAGVRVCPLLPASRPFAVQASAVASDGTVVVAAAGFARLRMPNGVTSTARVDLGTHPTAAELFRGEVVLAAEVGPSGNQHYTLTILDASLRQLARHETIDTSGLVADGNRLFVLGSRRGTFTQVPAVERCFTDGSLGCELETVEPCENGDGHLHEPWTTGGGLVGYGDGGGIYLRGNDGRWRCSAVTPRSFATAIGQVMDPRIAAATVVGDRAFVCAAGPGSTRAFVLTGSVASSGAPRELRLVLDTPSRCSGITREGDNVRVWIDAGPADFDAASGRLVGRPSWPETGVPEVPVSIAAQTPGMSLLFGPSGSGYVRSDRGPWQRVYGDGVYDDTVYRAIAARADGTFAVFREGLVHTVRAVDGDACQFDMGRVEMPALPRGLVLAAETGSGTFLVATATTVLRVTLGGAVERAAIAPLSAGRFTGVAPAADGVAFATSAGEVLWLSPHGEVQLMESQKSWSSMDGSSGVAWLGGVGSIGRVVPGVSGPVLEPDWLDALGGAPIGRTRAEPADFSAVDVECPSEANFGAAEIFAGAGRSQDLGSTLWRLDAECSFGGPLGLCPHPIVAAAQEAYREDRPIGAHPAGRNLLIPFADANLGLPGLPHVAVPVGKLHRSVRSSTGILLIGGSNALLMAVVPVFDR